MLYLYIIQISNSLFPFIYILTSDHQLGAVIMQDKKPTVIYQRNLNTTQKRFTITERDREFLSAI
jgi:hypothetical protein